MALSDHGQYSGVVDIARNGIDEVIRLQAQAKQDDALIRQMLEALEAGLNEVNAAGQSEGIYFGDDKDVDHKMEAAISTARARLGEKPT